MSIELLDQGRAARMLQAVKAGPIRSNVVYRTGRIGLVPPRYGDDVVGGAEAVLREVAHGLAARGWEVEVLTTCARDHFTWANHYPAGVEEHGQVVVRRFPAVVDTPRRERAELDALITMGHRLDIERQQRWINDDLRVPLLYHYLLDHSADYRALVFAPYLFWTTYACGQIDPDRTIIHPSLHDEPHAALDVFKPVIHGARGLWVQTGPEEALVERLFPHHRDMAMVGSGIDVPERYDASGFRERHDIDGPFLVYAGRREGGKRWEWLLQALARVLEAEELPFSLVTFGTGVVNPPDQIADRVIDLGFVGDDERNDAFAAAAAYLQPSPYESFSRSTMEAWLAGTPVIGNAFCDVVAWHIARSGAGLTFTDAYEFEQCLRFVAARPDDAAALGARGRTYVLEQYTWPQVLDRMENSVDKWLPA
jgi:glycosyltransferase involved in cell wall biosynthesis